MLLFIFKNYKALTNDNGTIEQRYFETERRRRELEDLEARLGDIRNEIAKLQGTIEADEGEIARLEKRIYKGSESIRQNSGEIKGIPSLSRNIERLKNLTAYQNNRSKQADTIIKRGY